MQTPYSPPVAPKKSPVGKIFAFGCGVPIGLLVLFLVIGAIAGKGKPSSSGVGGSSTAVASNAALAPYLGKWQGADGTTLWIRSGGKGDFNAGSTKVEGGGVTLDEKGKKLGISSFFGIGKEWVISKAPGSGDGSEMTLDGMVFRRTGGFGSSGAGGEAVSSTTAAPSAAECDKLARATLTEFDRAVTTRDFGSFYKASSKVWQKQTSPAELKSAFKVFIDQDVRLAGVLNTLKPTYEKPSVVDTEAGPELLLNGTYPSQPSKLRFKLGYLLEDGQWRAVSVKVDVGK